VDQSHTQNQARARAMRTTPRTRRDNYDYEDDLYDDAWPSRLPTSVRRYNSDVYAESGRVTADVQPGITRSERVPYAGRRASSPARRTAGELPTASTMQNSRRRPIDWAVDTDGQERHSDALTLSNPRSGRAAPSTQPPRKRNQPRLHWLVYVGAVMFIMILAWVGLSALTNWWQGVEENLQYGMPRTYQVDAVVGHNDSPSNPSHFIAINLHRHIEIIEFPGGDATKARVYIGPTLLGPNQDLTPVTLTFKDVNGDGKPDMIVNVQDAHIVFINDGTEFRPARPGEKIQL
jgi:hypothetical protein